MRSRREIDNVEDNLNETYDTIPIPLVLIDNSGKSIEDEPIVTMTTPPPKTTLIPSFTSSENYSPRPQLVEGKKDQTHCKHKFRA